MGVFTASGIVCRYANYKEHDRMLTLYTRERGRLDVVSRGCTKQNSPLLTASQPFVYSQFVLFEHKGKLSVNSADMQESFYPIRTDYDRFKAGLAMLALTVDGAREDDPNERLFKTLYYALSFLAYSECDPVDLYLAYLLKYLDHNGYRPMITSCAKCNCDLRHMQRLSFHAQSGGAVCEKCALGQEVSALALEAMRRILQLDDENLQKIKLPHKVRLEMMDILPDYARCVLERRVAALDIVQL